MQRSRPATVLIAVVEKTFFCSKHAIMLESAVADEIKLYKESEIQDENVRELDAVIRRGDDQLLKKRFGSRIRFGTAGLRAQMSFGRTCMNSVTIRQTAQGLCEYLCATYSAEDCATRPVVIGYDGRRNSRFFAHLVAATFLSRKFKVLLTDRPTPTPLTPFLVRERKALCGAQITASHNPKADNGFKLYGDRGAQINSPVDCAIQAQIETHLELWDVIKDYIDLPGRQLKVPIENPVETGWISYKQSIVSELGLKSSKFQTSPVKVVYTALHGVGFSYVKDLLCNHLDYPVEKFVSVHEQEDIDPEFSTVPFPNPEEKGALDMARHLADQTGCTTIVANDPDADRFAAMEKTSSGWHVFTGDEIGFIFAGILMDSLPNAETSSLSNVTMVRSIVTASHVDALMKTRGAHAVETFTGFKWMINKKLALEAENFKVLLAYEESLGYALTSACPDKDGISAIALWLSKVTELSAEGKTMHDYFDFLCNRAGAYFATNNSYYICDDPEMRDQCFADFRQSYPLQIGPYPITRIRDLRENYDSATEDRTADPALATTDDILTIWFQCGARITFRGSGTEPKLKYYSQQMHSHCYQKPAKQLQDVVAAVTHYFIADRPLVHAYAKAM